MKKLPPTTPAGKTIKEQIAAEVIAHESTQLEDGRNRWTINNERSSEIQRSLEIVDQIDPAVVFSTSKDKQGHSSVITVRLPQHWGGLLSYVREQVPAYKTTSEFVRDAIIQRVAWLLKNKENMNPAVLAPYLSEAMIDKIESEGRAFDTVSIKANKQIKSLVRRKDFNQAFTLIEYLEKNAREMNDPYRKRFLKQLRILKSKAQAALLQEEE